MSYTNNPQALAFMASRIIPIIRQDLIDQINKIRGNPREQSRLAQSTDNINKIMTQLDGLEKSLRSGVEIIKGESNYNGPRTGSKTDISLETNDGYKFNYNIVSGAGHVGSKFEGTPPFKVTQGSKAALDIHDVVKQAHGMNFTMQNDTRIGYAAGPPPSPGSVVQLDPLGGAGVQTPYAQAANNIVRPQPEVKPDVPQTFAVTINGIDYVPKGTG